MRAIEGEMTLMFHLINFYRYRNIKFCASYRDCLLPAFSALLITRAWNSPLFHLSLPQRRLTMQLRPSASFVWLRNVFCGMSDLRRQLFALFLSTGSLFSIKFRKDDKLGSRLASL